MTTSAATLADWFDAGVKLGATHMIVAVDTFDHEDFPVYVQPTEDVRKRHAEYAYREWTNVMEVYDLRLDKAAQMAERRAFYF